MVLSRVLKICSAIILITLTLTGCTYRCDLQQGNHITQEALNRLEPDLTKHEVQGIMGSTVVNPMYLSEEWNYSYGYIDGVHRDQPIKFHTITLFFKNGRLKSYQSDYWHPTNLPKARKQ